MITIVSTLLLFIGGLIMVSAKNNKFAETKEKRIIIKIGLLLVIFSIILFLFKFI